MFNTIDDLSAQAVTDFNNSGGVDANGYYAIGSDLDASGFTATVSNNLNNGYAVIPPMNGTLQGLGHTISNLTINDTGGAAFENGLVAELDGGGLISNVGLKNLSLTSSGGGFVGGLVGFNFGGTVSNSFVTGTATGSVSDLGGLVGFNYGGGIISNSFVAGASPGTATTISNSSQPGTTGGLVGDERRRFHCWFFGECERLRSERRVQWDGRSRRVQ